MQATILIPQRAKPRCISIYIHVFVYCFSDGYNISCCPISHHSKFDHLHNWLTRSTCHKWSCAAHSLLWVWRVFVCVLVSKSQYRGRETMQSISFHCSFEWMYSTVWTEFSACARRVCDFQLIDLFSRFLSFEATRITFIHKHTQAHWTQTKKVTLSFQFFVDFFFFLEQTIVCGRRCECIFYAA